MAKVQHPAHNNALSKSLASLAPTRVLRRCAAQNFGGLLESYAVQRKCL
jgi:hypothetical protein